LPDRDRQVARVLALAPRSLRDRLAAGEPLTLLDVREPRERTYCAIAVPATARDVHIPMRQVPAQLEALRQAAARGPLVVYCHHGVRSLAVAEWLADRGLRGIANLTGGIDAWSLEADASVPRYD
jgi:rhodanese-related sulfurtransferase